MTERFLEVAQPGRIKPGLHEPCATERTASADLIAERSGMLTNKVPAVRTPAMMHSLREQLVAQRPRGRVH
jgi:hypothetical protein